VPNGQRSYGATRAQDRLAYEPFTAARLATLEAAGTPVFINLTTDRCVTCLINERAALDSAVQGGWQCALT
jgi:thiol:disulfide interchange protein DsbD